MRDRIPRRDFIADALIAHEEMSVTAVSVMAPESFGMAVVEGIEYEDD